MRVVDPIEIFALMTPEPEEAPKHEYAIPLKAFKGMPTQLMQPFAQYVTELQERANKHFAALYLSSSPPKITVDPSGRKYLRVVENRATQRSVIAFVEKATGLIWKADGWAGPAKNYPRGEITDLNNVGLDGWGGFYAGSPVRTLKEIEA